MNLRCILSAGLLLEPSPTAVEVEAIRRLLSKAGPLVSESQALSYALVMALASTPAEALTSKEIDALRQVAYELEQLSWGGDSGTDSSKAKCHMVAARIETADTWPLNDHPRSWPHSPTVATFDSWVYKTCTVLVPVSLLTRSNR